jgi:hypothetical protein
LHCKFFKIFKQETDMKLDNINRISELNNEEISGIGGGWVQVVMAVAAVGALALEAYRQGKEDQTTCTYSGAD